MCKNFRTFKQKKTMIDINFELCRRISMNIFINLYFYKNRGFYLH